MTPHRQSDTDPPGFDVMEEWAEGAIEAGYPNVHAAAVEWCFTPPESYDDPWLDRIYDVWLFVRAQPCSCRVEADGEVDEPCERCRLLNVSGAGR